MARFFKSINPSSHHRAPAPSHPRALSSLLSPLSSLLLSLLLSSCQEGREAGDLLGQWRMAGSDKQYISFSGSIAWIRHLPEDEVYANFQHVGDSLFIQCYSIEGNPSDTILVENTYGFRPFNNIRVKVESLTSDKLILKKGSQTWSFDKY